MGLFARRPAFTIAAEPFEDDFDATTLVVDAPSALESEGQAVAPFEDLSDDGTIEPFLEPLLRDADARADAEGPKVSAGDRLVDRTVGETSDLGDVAHGQQNRVLLGRVGPFRIVLRNVVLVHTGETTVKEGDALVPPPSPAVNPLAPLGVGPSGRLR